MNAITKIKRLIPWEWKFFLKRSVGMLSFNQEYFDNTKVKILKAIEKSKREKVKIPKFRTIKKLKIIYSIHQFFPIHYSGTERYLLNLAKEFQKMGHSIQIVTYDPTPKIKTGDNNLLVNKYTYEGLRITSIYSSSQKTNDSLIEKNAEIQKFYSDLFDKEKPDVFHIAHPMYAIEGFWEAKKRGIKTLMTLTDYWMLCKNTFLLRNDSLPCFGPKKGYECIKTCFKTPLMKKRYSLSKKVLEEADQLICASHFVKQIFNQNGIKMKNTQVIRHGLDSKNIKNVKTIGNRVFVFGYTGAILPYKGVHDLISAFKQIANDSIRLHVYGDFNQDREYGDYIKRISKNDKRISIMGKYENKDEGKIHATLNCVVVPSIVFETFSLTAAASLAYGVPIIAPDLSGTNEMIINCKYGHIYKFLSIKDLRDIIIKRSKNVSQLSVSSTTVGQKQEAVKTLNTYIDSH